MPFDQCTMGNYTGCADVYVATRGLQRSNDVTWVLECKPAAIFQHYEHSVVAQCGNTAHLKRASVASKQSHVTWLNSSATTRRVVKLCHARAYFRASIPQYQKSPHRLKIRRQSAQGGQRLQYMTNARYTTRISPQPRTAPTPC